MKKTLLAAVALAGVMLNDVAFAQGPPSAFDAQSSTGNRIDRPTVIDVQKALIWTGNYDGIVDGDSGKGTRASIAAWQRSQNVPPTESLSDDQAHQLIGQAIAKRELWCTAPGYLDTR